MRIDVQNAILLLLCLVLLLSVFTLSALADEAPSATDDSFYLIPYNGVSSSGWQLQVSATNLQSSEPVYLSFYSTGSSSVYLCFFSEYYYESVRAEFRYGSSLGSFYSAHIPLIQSGEIYYGNVGSSFYLSSSQVPADAYVYSSLVDAISAFSSFIDSGGVDSSASSLQFTLPPGNVAYIPIPSGMSESITYSLTTTYYMAFGNNDTSRINQVVTVISSLPSSSNNLAPSSPKIPWTNNGNVNLLGISANKIYNGSIPSNYGGQYLVVVNPMTMPSQSGLIGGDTYTNGSININVSSSAGSPHIYPMSESLTITPGDGIGSESSYGDSGYTYEVDPETGEIVWTDPNGGNEAPVAGGNNPMPTPNTIFDWLRNISQQLSDFLRGPVQAVQVVVSAIRDFMGSFTQLYQWLPSPVYSLITSALMIALTIGVIKIFV